MLAALLLQNAVAGPPAPRAAPRLRTEVRCTPSSADEVVVCAEDPERFRLRPLPLRNADGSAGLPRAETGIAPGVSLAAEAEQGSVGNMPTNRAMIRLKFKF